MLSPFLTCPVRQMTMPRHLVPFSLLFVLLTGCPEPSADPDRTQELARIAEHLEQIDPYLETTLSEGGTAVGKNQMSKVFFDATEFLREHYQFSREEAEATHRK